jgi:hypothetical protein
MGEEWGRGIGGAWKGKEKGVKERGKGERSNGDTLNYKADASAGGCMPWVGLGETGEEGIGLFCNIFHHPL